MYVVLTADRSIFGAHSDFHTAQLTLFLHVVLHWKMLCCSSSFKKSSGCSLEELWLSLPRSFFNAADDVLLLLRSFNFSVYFSNKTKPHFERLIGQLAHGSLLSRIYSLLSIPIALIWIIIIILVVRLCKMHNRRISPHFDFGYVGDFVLLMSHSVETTTRFIKFLRRVTLFCGKYKSQSLADQGPLDGLFGVNLIENRI